jgi:hypothetical protein
MKIEIDTSSRLDKSGDTVFGFSDHAQKVIILRQTTRDQCLEKLRGRRLSRELRIFAACIYLLIEDHLDEITEIRIDQEYPEHEGEIKRYLANIIATYRPDALFKEEFIKIVSIGKKSRAHEVAWTTFRKQKKADKVLKTEDILNLLVK